MSRGRKPHREVSGFLGYPRLLKGDQEPGIWSQPVWVQMIVVLLTSSVTLNKLLSFFVPTLVLNADNNKNDDTSLTE